MPKIFPAMSLGRLMSPSATVIWAMKAASHVAMLYGLFVDLRNRQRPKEILEGGNAYIHGRKDSSHATVGP